MTASEVTEEVGRHRKRRVGEASHITHEGKSGFWLVDILGEFRNSRRGSPQNFLKASCIARMGEFQLAVSFWRSIFW